MIKGKFFRLLAIATLTASLSIFASGCGKKKVPSAEQGEAADREVVETTVATKAVTKVDTRSGIGSEESLVSDTRRGAVEDVILEGRSSSPMLPIYFDFDRFNIRADQRNRTENNADFLKQLSSVVVRIEGNCDERGTNEYNMALGERRARTAKKYLVNLGIAESRIETISYGEEKPLNYGHDELSWSQNRRDDFVISR